MTDALLTIDEAAAFLRCSTKTLRRWVHRGVLPEHRVGTGKLLFISDELHTAIRTSNTVSSLSTLPLLPLLPNAFPTSDDGWITAAVGINTPSLKAG